MKITSVIVNDYKRIRHVEVAPEADRVLVLIGGANRQGKTSLLDALDAAFGGKDAVLVDPVRHGAERADIRVELDGGAVVVRRVVRATGDSVLEVRQDGGKVRAPQEVLNGLIGARFLDPLEFLGKPAPEQRAQILRLCCDHETLGKLATERQRAFDLRRERAAELKRAQAELDRLPPARDPGAEVDIAALADEVTDLQARIAAKHRARAAVDAAQKVNAAAVQRVTEAQAALDRAIEERHRANRAEEEAWEAVQDADRRADSADERLARAQNELRQASEINAGVAWRRGEHKRRMEVTDEVEGLRLKVDTAQARIDEVDANRAALLAAATMPVDGLSISDDGVTLDGVPLEQASGAERLRVAVALAIAARPELQDVWVRDGALLDDESLLALERQAAAAGVRVWVERVGTRDPGVIVIRDGQVIA